MSEWNLGHVNTHPGSAVITESRCLLIKEHWDCVFKSCFGSSKKRKINIHKLFIPLNFALISKCWSSGAGPELARRCGSFCEVSESGMWCFCSEWGTKKEGKKAVWGLCVILPVLLTCVCLCTVYICLCGKRGIRGAMSGEISSHYHRHTFNHITHDHMLQ